MKRTSIRTKITKIFMLSSGIALFFAGGIFSIHDLIFFKNNLKTNFQVIMNIVSANITPALEFRDKKTAAEFIETLKFYPSIIRATVFAADGNVFAHYAQPGLVIPEFYALKNNKEKYFIESDYVLFQEIRNSNERLGYIYIETDRREFTKHVYTLLLAACGLLLASFLIAFLISKGLQKIVSNPILDLHKSVQALVSLDFSKRVVFSSDDELGELAETFNNMLTVLENTTVSRDYVNSIMTSMNECLVVLTTAGTIKLVNYALLQLLGYAEETLLGKSIGYILSGGETMVSSILQDITTKQGVRNYDLSYKTKMGEEIPVAFSGTVLKNNQGQLSGYVTVAADIRDLKRAVEREKESLRAVAEAEKKRLIEVETAYVQLEKTKNTLSEKTEELSRSNRDLEQFAYVASHDLQEPLRMVASYVELLARRYKNKLDTDANEFIEFAVDGSNRMKKLIQDLLAYSRVGTQAKAFAPVECQELFAVIMQDLKLLMEESGVTVTYDDASLPTIMADGAQLIQVLENLITNAIKFRCADQPFVHISVKSDSNFWIFSVMDNGIGIKPEYFERIFVIFQRLHTKAQYSGTGIGLAVCKRIVERHKGRIWLESEEGKGSTFYFSIPKSLGGTNDANAGTIV